MINPALRQSTPLQQPAEVCAEMIPEGGFIGDWQESAIYPSRMAFLPESCEAIAMAASYE